MKINSSELQRQIVSGFSPDEIHKYLASQGVKISRKKLNRAIEAAGTEIRQQAAVDFEYSRGEALLRLNELYKRSMLISDYKTALAVTREKAHLLGLQVNQETGEDVTDEGCLEKTLTLHQIIENELGQLDPDCNLDIKDLIKLAGEKLKGNNEKVD